MDILIKASLIGIEFAGMICFAFTLFRLPVRAQWIRVAGTAFALSFAYVYLCSDADLSGYSVAGLMFCEVALVSWLFRLPIFYSLLLSTMGYLVLSTVKTVIVIIGLAADLTAVRSILTSNWHLAGITLPAAVCLFLIACILNRYKIGFMFSISQFSAKESLRGYNLALCVAPVLGLAFLHVSRNHFEQFFSLHAYSMAGMIGLMVAGIYAAYRKNMGVIRKKYGAFKLHNDDGKPAQFAAKSIQRDD